MRSVAILWCWLSLVSGSVKADVLDDLADRDGMAGEFVQQIISPDGLVIDQSGGSFGLLRPHFLRWEILDPDHQLILADDQHLTQIDWDLEVVIVRPISDEDRSPLNWLLASRAELESAFNIVRSDAGTMLIPREPNASFIQLEIAHVSASGWLLKATDRTGQTLSVTLQENLDNPPRQADFVVPNTAF
jgi:outer membrane lipoprotein-sorting protein